MNDWIPLLVIPILAIPVLAWYIVMSEAQDNKLPNWLQKIFQIKYIGKYIGHTILISAILIVLYMIFFFKLP